MRTIHKLQNLKILKLFTMCENKSVICADISSDNCLNGHCESNKENKYSCLRGEMINRCGIVLMAFKSGKL